MSDVAALVVAPAAAVSAIELVTQRPVHLRTAWALAGATGLLLALIQVAPPVDYAYSRTLGTAQWLVTDRAGPAWLVQSTRDVTDLLTVPALVIVPLLLRGRSHRRRPNVRASVSMPRPAALPHDEPHHHDDQPVPLTLNLVTSRPPLHRQT